MDVSRLGPAVPPRDGRVAVDAPGWRALVPDVERIVARALDVASSHADVVLTDDRTVRRLNAEHRGRDKPTNVLTFEPAAPGWPGEIVLALGVVRREAARERRRPADHLAHLVVHGALHADGHDHGHAGQARAMEMAEARLLARIGVANPWRVK